MRKKALVVFLLLMGVLLINSCNVAEDPAVEKGALTIDFIDVQANESGYSSIISRGISSSTLTPTINMMAESYKINLQGPTGGPIEKIVNTPPFIEENMACGSWTISVSVLNNTSQEIGKSEVITKVINPGDNILLANIVPVSGDGQFNFSLAWTTGTLASPKVTLDVKGINETTPTTYEPTVVNNVASNTISLANGYYNVTVSLYDGTTLIHKENPFAMRIITNSVTSATYTIETSVPLGKLASTFVMNLSNPYEIMLSGWQEVVTDKEIINVVPTIFGNNFADEYWWYFDGVPTAIKNGSLSGEIFPINGALYPEGKHMLTFMAKKGNTLNSKGLLFYVATEKNFSLLLKKQSDNTIISNLPAVPVILKYGPETFDSIGLTYNESCLKWEGFATGKVSRISSLKVNGFNKFFVDFGEPRNYEKSLLLTETITEGFEDLATIKTYYGYNDGGIKKSDGSAADVGIPIFIVSTGPDYLMDVNSTGEITDDDFVIGEIMVGFKDGIPGSFEIQGFEANANTSFYILAKTSTHWGTSMVRPIPGYYGGNHSVIDVGPVIIGNPIQ